MVDLQVIIKTLDNFFDITWCWCDSAMSRFLPSVYDPIGFDWKNFFESDFVRIFNGLMIRWADEVGKCFLSVFPAPEVLENFLNQAEKWDILFLHHPILMRSWDPQWKMGSLFEPIDPDVLQKIKDRQLSVYTCHTPLDTNNEIWTNIAIMKALWWKLIGEFLEQWNGFVGRIIEIPTITTNKLIDKCLSIFDIPYLDFAWMERNDITKVAIVAGSGDKAEYMASAENLGAQAYISGEIFNRIDNDYGRSRYSDVKSYTEKTQLSLIGVSHAASEYLVMKIQMQEFIKNSFDITTILLPMNKRRVD